MSEIQIAAPRISSSEHWLAERLKLLEHEKELTKQYDRVNAERRRLPMVRVEKTYKLISPSGPVSFQDLFEGQRQLIVYHFMFDPEWNRGCTGCTYFVDALGDLSELKRKDTTFALVARAPIEKLLKYAEARKWNRSWYSSLGSDFNYDFHATLDKNVAPPEYNFRPSPEVEGEEHGLSVFFRTGEEIFHTYSTYARGTENLTNTYELLDVTPYGRQQEFEDSPSGWPQKPTYG